MSRVRQIIKRAERAIYSRKLGRRMRAIRDAKPVLIYQMGKVGSSTIVRTIDKLNLREPVFHIHTLKPDTRERAIQMELSHARRLTSNHLEVSGHLIGALSNGVFPARVITMTREPIGRAISHVFENIRRFAPNAKGNNSDIDLDQINDHLVQILSSSSGLANPTRWFDSELNDIYGIDVFSKPYNFDKGYTILSGPPVSSMVIRMEDLDRSLANALSDFFVIDVSDLQLEPDNIGSKKWYASALAEIKSNLKLTPDVLDSVLNTKYAQHFYKGERDQLIDKWS